VDIERDNFLKIMVTNCEIAEVLFVEMKTREKFSIYDFDDKKYRITLENSTELNYQKAVLTHYLHNKENDISEHFKQDAEKVFESFVEYNQKIHKTPIVAEDALQQLLFEVENVPFPTPQGYQFKFIDLFAGIGGFRIALQNLGGKCVFTSEWDKEAQKTYRANFGDVPFGDITKEETKRFIPDDFDILCAGFPCQAFSIAGKRGGFDDTRGTLFFDVAEIIRRKKPKAIFLENVKGLRNHDKGKTLETILNVLRNDLGYFVPEPQIINARDFGVPQNRERIYIVGFRNDLGIKNFNYPKPIEALVNFSAVKEEKVVPTKYYLSNQYISTLYNHKKRHESKGNGFGFEIIPDDGIANAVVCGGMGRERNLVIDNRIIDYTPTTHIKGEVNRDGIRKMTPREWARLQGFPDDFIIPVADASAYKQFGNSVAIPAIQATAEQITQLIGFKYDNRK
jgi:DNA (cytosine-5)-methyltransferase 1